jgi:hypothetical protein
VKAFWQKFVTNRPIATNSDPLGERPFLACFQLRQLATISSRNHLRITINNQVIPWTLKLSASPRQPIP